jgi:lysophospholipase L1-like esterase
MTMHWKSKEWTLIGMLLLAIPAVTTGKVDAAMAQAGSSSVIATTQVTDTVYRADGTLATGTVIVSWQAFTTALGQAVPSGTTSAAIGPNGALSVQLVPNAGSTPMGTYYTAVYHLDDGTVSREFWVVPASQTAVAVSSIKSTVLPVSVAMQTVSKSYVDTAIATAISGHPLDASSPYVLVTGSTMTGPLVLPADPVTANQASDKHYVDVNVAGLTSGLGQKVSLFAPGTQTISQPAGTQLQVNRMSGEEYASQYLSGLGGNGIANAISSPDCASGCNVILDRTYTPVEGYSPAGWNSGVGGTHLEDDRNGQRRDSYMNPTSSTGNGEDAGQVVDVTSTRNTAAEFAAGGSDEPSSFGLLIKHQGLTGGSNLFPQTIENVPYFKTNYQAMNVTGTYNTPGQHSLDAQTINCYGVGDCLIGSQFLTSSGGLRDEADEGAHPFDLQIQEDYTVFQGTCSVGCTEGSTVVTVSPTLGGGTQGEGRYLIDKNPAKVMTTGMVTGGGSAAPGATGTFSGTNFPVSVFLTTAQVIPSQSKNIAPGTVTVPIATSGVIAGFATSTAAIPSPSGVACVTDQPNNANPHNYEMATYTVVDATHLQMTLNKVHRAGATIAFGGLCGYGLEQTVDTVGQIRQVFPVIGSYSPTGLYYAGGLTPLVGLQGNTSAYLNVSLQIASLARSNGVVTVTAANDLPVDVNGLTMTVSGAADQSYNGSFAVTTTGGNTLTYAQTGANSTTTGGTVAVVTGGYALYPMAEVLGVFDTATNSVDGQLTLAANTVAWAANDPLEEPHYYQQAIAGDVMYVGQTTPRPTIAQTAGIEYEYNVGPGLSGWTVSNAAPATSYLGNGGTHTVPHAAYEDQGIWQYGMEMQAGEESVFRVHCTSRGCGRWNSGYNVFEFDGNNEQDSISYQPLNGTLGLNFGNAQFSFGGSGFSASTINAGTVNATTLNGAVSAAQLPLFGASGSSHGPGAVPDPGATAGTTRYLREDGTWTVPVGSSASKPIAGALADYNFLQGSGTTLTDNSGNGNNGTLATGTSAPTWTGVGLVFNGEQCATLPSSVNGSQTFMIGVYVNPLTNQVPAAKNLLLSSTLAASGLALTMQEGQAYDAGQSLSFLPSPSILNSALATNPNYSETSTTALASGFHVFTYVLGNTGNDRLFIDGVEVSPYNQQVSSLPLSSGNLKIGNGSTFGGWGTYATFYRLVTFTSNALTPAQILQYSNQITADVFNRGAAIAPRATPATAPQLFAIGDSITCGYDGSTGSCDLNPWPNQLALVNQPAYNIVNLGITGVPVQAIAASEPNRVAPECRTNAGPSVAIVFAGTNDMAQFYTTPQQTFTWLTAEIQILKSAGCRVLLGTMISRNSFGVVPTVDSEKDIYNPLILQGYKALGADGVVDFAANPVLGADNAYANGTYFQSDGTHPTPLGQQLLAAAASNSLNYYFGYNEASPHNVTSLPYSMAAGDGEVSVAGLTNAGTVTLPDCTGQSGAVYRINNPQSAFAVTIAPLNGSELINGLPLATPVTVPANATVTLRDVPNTKTVSGCHWEM